VGGLLDRRADVASHLMDRGVGGAATALCDPTDARAPAAVREQAHPGDHRRVHLWVLVGITLLAGALRFSTLDLQSYWFDESVTVVDVLQPGLWETLRAVALQDVTPPLYFVLAWGWTNVFGDGEVGLRSLSALFGTATVPVAYAFGARLSSPRAGLILAGLFAVSPAMLWFGQEGRAYALLLLVSALSLLLWVRALQEQSRRAITLWALASALVLLSHYFGGFLVAVESAGLILAVKPRRHVLTAVAVLGAIAAALVPLVWLQMTNGGTRWVDDTPLSVRLSALPGNFLMGPQDVLGTPFVVATAVAALLFITVVVVRSVPGLPRPAFRLFDGPLLDRSELSAATLAAAVGGGTIAIPLVLALLGKDYILWRYLVVAWLPFAAMLAVALGGRRLGRTGLAAAWTVGLALLALSITTLLNSRHQREDWRQVSMLMGPAGADRAVAIADWFEREPLIAYGREIEAMPRTGATVDEIVVVGQLPLWTTGSSASDEPSSPEPPRFDPPPPGFRLTEHRTLDRMTFIRFKADRPRTVTPAGLWATNRIPPEAVVLEPVDAPLPQPEPQEAFR
jgi:4-amino-4-deoxy-L-arabinose transferase-like glycosyltransferase